jgi:hypothetical protein
VVGRLLHANTPRHLDVPGRCMPQLDQTTALTEQGN